MPAEIKFPQPYLSETWLHGGQVINEVVFVGTNIPTRVNCEMSCPIKLFNGKITCSGLQPVTSTEGEHVRSSDGSVTLVSTDIPAQRAYVSIPEPVVESNALLLRSAVDNNALPCIPVVTFSAEKGRVPTYAFSNTPDVYASRAQRAMDPNSEYAPNIVKTPQD